jgi:hypothetical protein
MIAINTFLSATVTPITTHTRDRIKQAHTDSTINLISFQIFKAKLLHVMQQHVGQSDTLSDLAISKIQELKTEQYAYN